MTKSMTGYGLASYENDKVLISVEVKTLNSKFLDAFIKLPRAFTDKEIEVKSLISEKLERGKILLTVDLQNKDNVAPKITLDKDLFKLYYQQYYDLAKEVGGNTDEIFKIALSSPEVLNNDISKDSVEVQQEWQKLFSVIQEAVQNCNEFRIKEGQILRQKLIENINRIKNFSDEIALLDPGRNHAIKLRLRQHINDLEQIDENRFEQEIIYYLEKLDINEEKVRLSSHIDFFLEVINNENAPGKKLGFISQEIGREINTIGSKANDAAIQRFVVGMKEELEQVKEQLLNIL
jgi:uncharacterized protein (TIGR00255 family)